MLPRAALAPSPYVVIMLKMIYWYWDNDNNKTQLNHVNKAPQTYVSFIYQFALLIRLRFQTLSTSLHLSLIFLVYKKKQIINTIKATVKRLYWNLIIWQPGNFLVMHETDCVLQVTFCTELMEWSLGLWTYPYGIPTGIHSLNFYDPTRVRYFRQQISNIISTRSLTCVITHRPGVF